MGECFGCSEFKTCGLTGLPSTCPCSICIIKMMCKDGCPNYYDYFHKQRVAEAAQGIIKNVENTKND